MHFPDDLIAQGDTILDTLIGLHQREAAAEDMAPLFGADVTLDGTPCCYLQTRDVLSAHQQLEMRIVMKDLIDWLHRFHEQMPAGWTMDLTVHKNHSLSLALTQYEGTRIINSMRQNNTTLAQLISLFS